MSYLNEADKIADKFLDYANEKGIKEDQAIAIFSALGNADVSEDELFTEFKQAIDKQAKKQESFKGRGQALKESTVEKFMVRGFLSAILFTELDNDDEPLEANYSIYDFSKDAVRKVEKIIDYFISKCPTPIPEICEEVGQDEDDVGINIWFEMSGQGAGFFDGDFDPYGDMLSDLSEEVQKKFRINDAYISDSGEIELE